MNNRDKEHIVNKRVLRPGGRLAVVAISKEGKQGFLIRAFEWTHRHFPNLMDCRPIYVRRAIEEAGFAIRDATIDHMWVPVEIVLGVKPRAVSLHKRLAERRPL